MLYTKRPALFR